MRKFFQTCLKGKLIHDQKEREPITHFRLCSIARKGEEKLCLFSLFDFNEKEDRRENLREFLWYQPFFHSQIPQVKVIHYFREANYCADVLARLGTHQGSDLLFYNSPPTLLLNFYLSDLYGLGNVGLCTDNDVAVSVSQFVE